MNGSGIILTSLIALCVGTSQAAIQYTQCPATHFAEYEGNLLVQTQINCTWPISTHGTDATFVLMVTADIASNQNIPHCTEASSEYATFPDGEKVCASKMNMCKIYHSPRVVPHTNYTLFDANELGLCHVPWLPAKSWPPTINITILVEHFKANITYKLVPVSVLINPEATTRDDGKQETSATTTITTSSQSETSVTSSTTEDARGSMVSASAELSSSSSSSGSAAATTSGNSKMQNSSHAATLALTASQSVLSTAQTASTSLLTATRSAAAAATSDKPTTTTTTTSTTADGPTLLTGSLVWIILIALSLTAIATASVINLVYRRRRNRKRSNSNTDINPYAVHVSLRDDNISSNYSNVVLTTSPYDVIDLDGNKKRKKSPNTQEGPYLQPIPATGDRQYCEIGLEDTSHEAAATTSFGRKNFFLYDVASDIPKRKGTYDKAEDAAPPLPVKAAQPQQPVGAYSEIVAIKQMDPNAVAYSLIVPPDEIACSSSENKGSPQFGLIEPNNNDLVAVTENPTGHSPYGEIIGTVNEDSGALNRFKKVDDKYKEVRKRSADT